MMALTLSLVLLGNTFVCDIQLFSLTLIFFFTIYLQWRQCDLVNFLGDRLSLLCNIKGHERHEKIEEDIISGPNKRR